MKPHYDSATAAWANALDYILKYGHTVSPRGKSTLEVLDQPHLMVDMSMPVLASRARKLNYAFMAAEALWITDGANDLATLTSVNPNMAEYSDDGLTLTGAYGPMIKSQEQYVLEKLLAEDTTRQAALTIWRPNPTVSKDIPCTIAMVFSIRSNQLHNHTFMRSSDIWFGIPYDVFSFSMVAAKFACLYNTRRDRGLPPVELGGLIITPVSSHLYAEHEEAANLALRSLVTEKEFHQDPGGLQRLVREGNWQAIQQSLRHTKERETSEVGLEWQLRPWSL